MDKGKNLAGSGFGRAITAVLVAWAAVSSAAGQGSSTTVGSDSPQIEIDLARSTAREQLAKHTLEQVLASHDLRKYTFTRKVVIEQKGPPTTHFRS